MRGVVAGPADDVASGCFGFFHLLHSGGRRTGPDARSSALDALNYASIDAICVPMRTTIALDDELMKRAETFTGLKEKSALVREALRALIERESAKRLARLGGSAPSIETPPRREFPSSEPKRG